MPVDLQPARLNVRNVSLGYARRLVAEHLDVSVPDGSFTVIVGPNACGKSTLLRAMARLLRPAEGEITLDGRSIAGFSGKQLAREIGLLPQASIAPEGITVFDLVARGRYPHQKITRQFSVADEQAVNEALEATNTVELAHRTVDELSGGQRQRVWVAMALAQQTPILLLDEPTTYLDIAHQVELLELCRTLNEQGRTMVAVLHDLNQAARYASHLIAMKDGQIVAQGKPAELMTEELVHKVFGLRSHVIQDPYAKCPLVLPA
ncbi:ABC transporter ATP-binding protein [Glutamicibacter sp. NPDC087344]|uniref:ABC transporter ATP-binding protein n=1 Tax=Glutamicibacter sp. NPDC087344 TaxID=3363994 RepID=UPI00382F54FF